MHVCVCVCVCVRENISLKNLYYQMEEDYNLPNSIVNQRVSFIKKRRIVYIKHLFKYT